MANAPILVELPGDHLYTQECEIQTLTYADATTLSIVQKTNDVKRLFEIVNRRMNLEVTKLTFPDLWFSLYWQRINSYPSFPIKLPWECPNCGQKNLDELSASKLIIKDLDPQYEHGLTVDFPSAGKLKLRLKLVGDELEVAKYIRKNSLKEDDELFEQLLTACMLEPNGGDLSYRYNIVRNEMTAEDHYVLKGFENEFDYGVQDYSEFTCEDDSCKEVTKVRCQFELVSFFPSLSDNRNIRSRILFHKPPGASDGQSGECGSSETDLHQGEARTKPERPETKKGSTKGSDESTEEVMRRIQEGVAAVEHPEVETGNYEDVISSR